MVQVAIQSGSENLASALPAAADIRAQLESILASHEFAVPERARKFLAYVVKETLAGRADRIKAYSIGIEVFGREASFDAQADPVVRIEAGRLRRALERYYLTAGLADEVLITIPKGGYVPLFVSRPPTPSPAEPADKGPAAAVPVVAEPPSSLPRPLPRWEWIALAAMTVLVIGLLPLRGLEPAEPPTSLALPTDATAFGAPTLLVEPFEDLNRTASSAIVTRGLTEEIIGQIAKFKELIVMAERFPTEGNSAPAEPPPLARFALSGSVRIVGDELRLSARLTNIGNGSILWVHSYDADLGVQQLLAVQAEIARGVTTALAQPYGVIFQADATRVAQTAPEDWEAYTCTLAYYTYRVDIGSRAHASVQDCLERAVERYPTYATAWALLSIIYLDEFRFRYRINASRPPPIKRALDLARRAVDLDPQNVRAQQAYMMALYLNGEIAQALRVGEQALSTNANDTELRAEYGTRLALSGEWEKGSSLIWDALRRNAGPQGYYEYVLAVCFYMQKDYETAASWVRKADLQSNPLYHFVAAAIFGQLGLSVEAHGERDWINEHAAEILLNVREELRIRVNRAGDQAHFIDGLKKAGLAVPEIIATPAP